MLSYSYFIMPLENYNTIRSGKRARLINTTPTVCDRCSSSSKRAQALPILTVTLEALTVPVDPGSTRRSSLDIVGTVSALAKTTGLASSTGKTSAFPALVHRVDDPVDAGIIADLGVRRIDQNDFVILHCCVLVHPVRVQNAKVSILASDLFLSNVLKVTVELKVVDTLVLGFTEDHTTVVGALTSSATDSTSDNDVSLLGLVTETVSLIDTSRLSNTSDFRALTVLPSADAEEETEGVTLLVTPKFFHVFVATHLDEL